MAAGELLEPNQIMFTNWEPKLKNRFIMNLFFNLGSQLLNIISCGSNNSPTAI